MKTYLNALGIACALGMDKQSIADNLFSSVDAKGQRNAEEFSCLSMSTDYSAVAPSLMLGKLPQALTPLPEKFATFNCRNNQLILHILHEILEEVTHAIHTFGRHRVGVVLGSSTSGIAEGEEALRFFSQHGELPSDFYYQQQEIGGPSEFLAEYLSLQGPALTISTACSSSAKAFASGQRLLTSGQCDAVIVGGVDTLCGLTIHGFSALTAMSSSRCNPFSKNRDGINIGEGGALFLMTRDLSSIELSGVGESSDAYHMSAPDPSGKGAVASMQAALQQAGVTPSNIDYVNLHGTGTLQNDAMESVAVGSVFGRAVPMSSTKGYIGHTLGAAGAIEVGICYLTLSEKNPQEWLPVQLWDEQPDEITENVRFVSDGETLIAGKIPRYCLSNSFAFGGSNVSVVIGRAM